MNPFFNQVLIQFRPGFKLVKEPEMRFKLSSSVTKIGSDELGIDLTQLSLIWI